MKSIKDLSLKLFGHRVLLERVMERQGSILVPESRENMHQIGRVIAVGDGLDPESVFAQKGLGTVRVRPETKAPLVELGDLVYFQTNLVMAAYSRYELGSEAYLNVHQTELIARLASNTVTYDNFEPLGEWALVQPHKREGDSPLVLPDNLKQPGYLYWTLAKKSARCSLPVEPGQEIMVNTGRINPIFIQRLNADKGELEYSEFSYISQDNILGCVE